VDAEWQRRTDEFHNNTVQGKEIFIAFGQHPT